MIFITIFFSRCCSLSRNNQTTVSENKEIIQLTLNEYFKKNENTTKRDSAIMLIETIYILDKKFLTRVKSSTVFYNKIKDNCKKLDKKNYDSLSFEMQKRKCNYYKNYKNLLTYKDYIFFGKQEKYSKTLNYKNLVTDKKIKLVDSISFNKKPDIKINIKNKIKFTGPFYNENKKIALIQFQHFTSYECLDTSNWFVVFQKKRNKWKLIGDVNNVIR